VPIGVIGLSGVFRRGITDALSFRELDFEARVGEIDVGWATGRTVFGGPALMPFLHIIVTSFSRPQKALTPCEDHPCQ
jgi:hypothetical protein